VRESFRRAGTVLINRQATKSKRGRPQSRRVSLPVLMENLSIDEAPSSIRGPFPAN
jgi:hypothetical protein